MDDMTREQRHKNMSHIRAKDTKPEVLLRKALWKRGIRYRKNYVALPGKPDIVFTKYKSLRSLSMGIFGTPAVIKILLGNRSHPIKNTGKRS